MEAPRRTRRLNRAKSDCGEQAFRGAKQIVIPMTIQEYKENWDDPSAMRRLIDQVWREFPELFPKGFEMGYALHGHGRESRKLKGVRLRKVVLKDGSSFWLRPGFALGYMTGTVDELAHPLLLASYGVPVWLLTAVFGHNDMFWYRLFERFGRSSLVGTTVRDPARLPEHLAADEHHVDWCGTQGYVALTAAEGCVLGVGLTDAADDAHLKTAYSDFATEARELKPDYAPKTVNTDGWTPTQNAFRSLFSQIVVVLCFLHGFLKIRDRCRKNHDLHRRVWDVYRAATVEEFRRRMDEFQQWVQTQTFTASVREMLTKLWNKTGEYVIAYSHPGCRRTSNAVDRPMNRLCRLMYAGRGLHGHQAPSERRLRGWALLLNFRNFTPRSNQRRDHACPAHRLSGKKYHQHWLHNLSVSTSLLGGRKMTPAIR
jgi:hypothetical protein